MQPRKGSRKPQQAQSEAASFVWGLFQVLAVLVLVLIGLGFLQDFNAANEKDGGRHTTQVKEWPQGFDPSACRTKGLCEDTTGKSPNVKL